MWTNCYKNVFTTFIVGCVISTAIATDPLSVSARFESNQRLYFIFTSMQMENDRDDLRPYREFICVENFDR